jgi:hypothetical protein
VIDMPTWGPGDEVDEGLRALRAHDAPPERVERVRARCLGALAMRREGAVRRARPLAGRTRWLEPALAFSLAALYLAEAVARALAVYAWR